MAKPEGEKQAGEQKSREIVRLTLDLSPRLNAALERIVDEAGITKSEALRTGIELLTHAVKAKTEGYTVGAWRDNAETGVRQEREFIGVPGWPKKPTEADLKPGDLAKSSLMEGYNLDNNPRVQGVRRRLLGEGNNTTTQAPQSGRPPRPR